MPESPPSFFARLTLAVGTFFRLLGDAQFAQRIARMDAAAAPQLPELQQPVEPAMQVAPTTRDLGPAMQLLALLQREGRLIDFLKQDILGFGDADVGTAARVVHQGCRRALEHAIVLEPIRDEPEGSPIQLASGFDTKRHRLVGNVTGQPPYRGILRHRGWRIDKLTLEEPLATADLTVAAPAEVEL